MKKWKIALLILLIFGIGISVYVYNSQEKEKQEKEKIAWDKAQKKNTISAYEEFLEKYPKSKFAHESRSRIESLKKERHPWFRDVKKAKIIIEEEFYVNGKFKHVSIDTPITLWLEEFVGINVIKNKDEDSDMIVRVKVSGQIKGAWYGSSFYKHFGFPGVPKEQFAYTGGAINGTISFEVGSNKIEESFRGEKELESEITKGSWKDPESALSAIMARASFNEKIAILLYRAFGLTPFISAMKSEDLYVSQNAKYAFLMLKDPRAVDALIEALKDEDWGVRARAAEALREITGQDFGKDPEKWQKWWEKNKGRFIKRTQ
jgi:hypothetical protein